MDSKEYVIMILGITTLVMAAGWDRDHKTLIKERTEHAQVVQNFISAQDLANQKAKAVETALVKEAKKNAEEADLRYSDLYDVYHANLLRYQAYQSNGSKPSGGKLQPTQGTLGSSKGSYVSITLDDANVCAVNTARLQTAHDWAKEMQDAAKERLKSEDDQPQY